MSAIENVIAHFDEQGAFEMKVPEWKLTVYAKPATMSFRSLIIGDARKYCEDKDRPDAVPQMEMIYAVIHGALDENGAKLFKKIDATELAMKGDSKVVARVGAFVLTGIKPGSSEAAKETSEEAEKN